MFLTKPWHMNSKLQTLLLVAYLLTAVLITIICFANILSLPFSLKYLTLVSIDKVKSIFTIPKSNSMKELDFGKTFWDYQKQLLNEKGLKILKANPAYLFQKCISKKVNNFNEVILSDMSKNDDMMLRIIGSCFILVSDSDLSNENDKKNYLKYFRQLAFLLILALGALFFFNIKQTETAVSTTFKCPESDNKISETSVSAIKNVDIKDANLKTDNTITKYILKKPPQNTENKSSSKNWKKPFHETTGEYYIFGKLKDSSKVHNDWLDKKETSLATKFVFKDGIKKTPVICNPNKQSTELKLSEAKKNILKSKQKQGNFIETCKSFELKKEKLPKYSFGLSTDDSGDDIIIIENPFLQHTDTIENKPEYSFDITTETGKAQFKKYFKSKKEVHPNEKDSKENIDSQTTRKKEDSKNKMDLSFPSKNQANSGIWNNNSIYQKENYLSKPIGMPIPLWPISPNSIDQDASTRKSLDLYIDNKEFLNNYQSLNFSKDILEKPGKYFLDPKPLYPKKVHLVPKSEIKESIIKKGTKT